MANSYKLRLAEETITRLIVRGCLVLLGAVFLFGPSGLFAWGSSNRQLAVRQSELRTLSLQRDVLQNRVALLDPHHVDADLAGELLRSNLNVVHPDELVMLLN